LFVLDRSEIFQPEGARYYFIFQLGGSILAVLAFVISVNYLVIIIILPMIIYFVWIRRYFVTSSREIKRIEGAST